MTLAIVRQLNTAATQICAPRAALSEVSDGSRQLEKLLLGIDSHAHDALTRSGPFTSGIVALHTAVTLCRDRYAFFAVCLEHLAHTEYSLSLLDEISSTPALDPTLRNALLDDRGRWQSHLGERARVLAFAITTTLIPTFNELATSRLSTVRHFLTSLESQITLH